MTFDVEIDGITDVEPLDCPAKIGFGGFHQQMVVVGHQAVGVNADGKPRTGGFKILEKLFPVPKALEYVFTGIATVDHMAKGTGIFDP